MAHWTRAGVFLALMAAILAAAGRIVVESFPNATGVGVLLGAYVAVLSFLCLFMRGATRKD